MAWNDPQWGKKNSGGPPDLDELWRQFNQKLNALFGGKKTPPNGGSPQVNRFGGFGVVSAILLLIWFATGFYIVDAGKRGVVLRFGKYLETTEPGPRWHWPFPIESVEVINLEQVRSIEIGYRKTGNVINKVAKEALMLTAELNIIDIQFAVQYILKDAEDYLFFNREPDAAVRQAAESAIREVVGKNKMDFALNEGRGQIAASAHKLMQEILDRYRSGILISKVNMQNAQPPDQVQEAFQDVVKAGQDRVRLTNEGQAYANEVIPKAKGTASRLLAEASGYNQSVIANAEGNVNRFKQVLVEYSKAPRVTRDRMYLDTMQQIFANTNKVIVDQKSGSNLLYLPLDKLIQNTGPTSEAPVSRPSVEANPVPEPTSRGRDALRSRDREFRP